MQFPLTLMDMMLWAGMIAILLLVTSEFLSPHYGQIGLLIDKRKLRLTALFSTILFILVALLQIYEILTF